MPANDPTPTEGQEGSGENSTTTATDRLEISRSRFGSVQASAAERDGMWSSFDVGGTFEDSSFRVSGYAYDDEDPQIEVTLVGGNIDMRLTLSPAQARQFAADLEATADAAGDLNPDANGDPTDRSEDDRRILYGDE